MAGRGQIVPELDRLAGALAEQMAGRGDWPSRSPWIRAAMEALPRHLFAPDLLYHWDGRAYVPVDRRTDPDGWTRLVYADPDTAAVPQVTNGLPSSSLSCAAVVADMLDSLLLEPGQRVLELGTGTGWNAALLARRAGHGRVASVEVDEGLAGAARERVEAAGTPVDVRVADGALGLPEGAPYDRVIATYAVPRVPWTWVEQCAPGGRIVFPWGPLGHVALTVAPDGRSASGRVQGLAQFMSARGAEDRARDYAAVRGTGPADGERPVHRDLTPLHEGYGLRFALRVAVPGLRLTTAVDEDGVNAWLHDGHGSWASLTAEPDGTTTARRGGPRRLADEVEHAWDRWRALGSPGPREYGMTVHQDRQYVWCLDPATGPRWPVGDGAPAQPRPAH
ncbi:methyltransferase domain-containing protein [Streptomyces sp. NPDC047002]|uniref:methyltransferase domain-containing protein n=1 Tax=Streptomyces sp. NPDC047002 TaxID=3155475 RepID=UPI00345481C2